MTVIPQNQIVPVNSTSYVDMLGLLVGLSRLPGEESHVFAERIDLAISADRGANYVGLMNSLVIELGLEMSPAARIFSDVDFVLSVTFGALDVSVAGQSLHIHLLELTSDDFWQWKTVSQVLDEMRSLSDLWIEQPLEDRPAHQLVRQSNSTLVTGEILDSTKTVRLAHGRLVPGSARFSTRVPPYVIGSDGQTLHFDTPCVDGTSVTYRYLTCPYNLVASPVSVFSLTDPLVQSAALGSNGKVIYQVREYVQELMRRDGSYWGR